MQGGTGRERKKERQRKTPSGRETKAGFRDERLQRKLLNYKKDSCFRDSGRICQVCLDLWNKMIVFVVTYRIEIIGVGETIGKN